MQTDITTLVTSAQNEIAALSDTEKLRDELELIAYVTSHDLQAPLRVIQNCCEELRQHPDQANQATVEMLVSEATRMKTLMQGMLDYVRLETFVPAQTTLDGNEIVSAAIALLPEEINAAHATITCDALPQIKGHRGRLTRLFAQLIDNALKFRSTDSPRVHISARRSGNAWEFCVRDNGIGIAEEHHRIIFTLFQRLHSAETYPGHGIGLALARKIVEAHGGKIWVESTPCAGSAFYFMLPASGNATS